MPRARASKRKDTGQWTVRWRTLEGAQRRRVCPDRDTAEQLAQEVTRSLALGRDWKPEARSEGTGVGDAMMAFLDDASRSKAPRTVDLYIETLDSFRAWLADQGVTQLSKLTRQHLRDYWTHLRDPKTARHGRQRSTETVRKHLTRIQVWWKSAYDSDEYPDCPPPRRIELPRTVTPEPVAPTWAQLDRMVDQLDEEGWHFRGALIQRYTGMRVGALLELRWGDVDLDARELRIRPETTKGGYGGRTIPLHPALAGEMAGWGVRDGLVVDGGITYADKMYRRSLTSAWRRSGVPEAVWRGQTTHCARKTIETEWVAAGVAQGVIDAFLGHTAAGTGGRHYRAPRAVWEHMARAVAEVVPEYGASGVLCPRSAQVPLRPGV